MFQSILFNAFHNLAIFCIITAIPRTNSRSCYLCSHWFVLSVNLNFHSENNFLLNQNTKTLLNSKPITVPDIPVPITHGPRRSYHSKALCHTRSITIQKGKVALQKFTTHFPTLLLQNCNMVGNRVSIWCQISSDNIEKVGFWTVYFAAEESLELDLTRILDATKTAHFLKAYLYNFVLMITKELFKICF